MGTNFNYVIVPKEIQEPKDLQKFYDQYAEKLSNDYGEDFEGYSGDLASDNGDLEIKDLKMDLPRYNEPLKQESFDDDYESVQKMSVFVEGHAEKWGPSIAIKVNEQWVICGAYSD